jgi:hypothetical protein
LLIEELDRTLAAVVSHDNTEAKGERKIGHYPHSVTKDIYCFPEEGIGEISSKEKNEIWGARGLLHHQSAIFPRIG